ncbi:Cu-binding protein [Malassezia pachydermatis]|uniref:Sco1-involved in stabilization of cox1p and cox2p n=1 Tax=Malassezia pachydermatis TaxID=77020 RepID=A0A0M8MME3_9BASI|nr:sco1-involved in stabilization of cox1p and cox2p [Malassezia pachydermatis]KOS15416.1 sco1-involved in stabilization of cox1p and cox2p [Malassezia pachydermatis]
MLRASARPLRVGVSPIVRQRMLPLPARALPQPFRALSTEGERPTSKASHTTLPPTNSTGPFNLPAAALFIATGVGLYFYFQHEKAKMAEAKQKKMEEQAAIGRPRIGGPFELVSSTGHPFTEKDLLGSFSLIYFGFTNCPDICPEELDKMSAVVDEVAKTHGYVINPVFITCDPARDRVPMVAEYIADFHPRMVGLTGSYEAVKAACKAFRVYFSTPPGADPSTDYLVDHSIFFYLMDPEGKFVDAFGKSSTEEEVRDKALDYIQRWRATGLPLEEANAKHKAATDGRALSTDQELFSEPSLTPSVPPAVVPQDRLI